MRLIDVDELGVGRCSKDVLPAAYCAGWNGLLGLVEKAPTVDAVVVTRCKDCKHFKNYGKTSLLIDGKNFKAGWCHRRARFDEEYRMPPDGFCSYGERKDNGDG